MMGESEPIRVLLVDDNRTVVWGLSKLIQGEWPRMSLAGTAHTRAQTLNLAWAHPDVILLDLYLDGDRTVDVLPELLRRSGGRALIYTGLHDLRLHRDAMQCGAMGVVEKGEPAEVILDAIACVHQGQLWNLGLHDALDPRRPAKPPAESAVMRRVASLTPRERRIIAEDVARFYAADQTGGQRPPIDASTRRELAAICGKLGLRDRTELLNFAHQYGLVEPQA
jgi:DNA-binding NarL/FixJ family response regulator